MAVNEPTRPFSKEDVATPAKAMSLRAVSGSRVHKLGRVAVAASGKGKAIHQSPMIVWLDQKTQCTVFKRTGAMPLVRVGRDEYDWIGMTFTPQNALQIKAAQARHM